MNHQIKMILTLAAFSLTALNGLALANARGQIKGPAKKEILVKILDGTRSEEVRSFSAFVAAGAQIEVVVPGTYRISGPANKFSRRNMDALEKDSMVEYFQPNYPITLPEDLKIQDPLVRTAVARSMARQGFKPTPKIDNPAIPDLPTSAQGADPMLKNQWGMLDIGAQEAWTVTTGRPDLIVAVIDSGVDYTHEDLLPNIWRNPKEIPNNGIDDDHNGFIDDVIGWDFVSNDNKPYDLAVDPMDLLTKGGNPGHGTHCAGNVAAKGGNGLGISGVAPNVKIMPLRFISDKGSGTTADAVKAIRYAVDNGAKILSNSWGSEGEDPAEGTENKALRDAILYAQNHGVLFFAAAGNGHKGKGYDNDSDPAPSYPATYPYENIVSVAAVDIKDHLAGFSNWGLKSVHLGAPGVDIFSTTVGGNYSNYVINVGGFEITWDGTSMATPHVAGAAALYWSAHPEKSWQDVKQALLASTRKISSLQGKTVTGGKLDVKALLK